MVIKKAFIAHFISLAVTFVIVIGVFKLTGYRNLIEAAFFQGFIASVIGVRSGLPSWWILINLFFFPSVVVCLSLGISPLVSCSFLLLIALMNWNSMFERVPLYLTSNQGKEILASFITKGDQKFIDLGSGLGGTLCYLAKIYPNSEFVGVETAPLNFAFSKFRSLFHRNLKIYYKSLWDEDLSKYDIVYTFLSPAPMPKVFEKAKREMKKGTLFISNTFTVPGVKPKKTIDLKNWRSSSFYVFEI